MAGLLVTNAAKKFVTGVSMLATLLTITPQPAAAAGPATKTPIQHVVVIFQENVSFDHYFGTYPISANLSGEIPWYRSLANTPTVNGLVLANTNLNPNSARPFRLSPSQNYTCDQDHDYTPEQSAFDMGLMDKFPQNTGTGGPGCPDYGHGTALTMGYYDGNTVTALWNYAQYYAMSDNSFGTNFGPSTPGALNLISGQTGGEDGTHTNGDLTGAVLNGTVIGDDDPYYDDCSSSTNFGMKSTNKNIGDLLNTAGITWGWFQGGFRPTTAATSTTPAVCGATSTNLGGASSPDYSPHHEAFQYYASTSNPHHLPPSAVSAIGTTDQANHQYDLIDFWDAFDNGNLPAVSFLKAKKIQDGHAGYSSPLDEQQFITETLNRIMDSSYWPTTAVVILYDDSDGWYDHQMPIIANSSATSADSISGAGLCGNGKPLAGIEGRCGYGPRLPLLVISPYAHVNYVDHSTTDQSSVIHAIEYNWGLPSIGGGSFDAYSGNLFNLFNFGAPAAKRVYLDTTTGQILAVK